MTREEFAAVVERRGGYRITLRLIPTHDGGRETPLGGESEYRANWTVGSIGPAEQIGGPILIDAERLQPGEEASATLVPLVPESWAEIDVRIGTELTAYEGARAVAHAIVTDTIGVTVATFMPPGALAAHAEWEAVNADALVAIPTEAVRVDVGRAAGGGTFVRVVVDTKYAKRFEID